MLKSGVFFKDTSNSLILYWSNHSKARVALTTHQPDDLVNTIDFLFTLNIHQGIPSRSSKCTFYRHAHLFVKKLINLFELASEYVLQFNAFFIS